MLEDAQVSVLLTQQHLVERLPEYSGQLVCLDEVWSQILQNKQDNPIKVTTTSHLANIIYTSGTTGKPKGVMIEHSGLYNLALAQIQTFDLDCDSRVLQFASFSFDACVWEMLMSFGSGAKLYLGTKNSLAPGTPLIERLNDDGITHITLPPSVLAVLPPEELPTLQTIIVAGEACSIELMRQWSAVKNFFNAYGPTEASICATISKCTAKEQKVCIGRPINNVQVYILDQNEQPVPVGVAGELHIGGAGLARGYLKRPELTQEKFIPNRFSKETGSRLYKTGDLARYLEDGSIEYLGRIDNQVKIRGFRIELGEIEAVLSQYPDVQANCVIAQCDSPGDQRLVAYIVGQAEQTPTTKELRQFLKSKLPDYMVPNAFVILESLPLTPNGKIDRRALPSPDLTQLQDKFIAPRTPIEEIVALVWTQVLKIEQVGIHDNFFELGGHSLLATQLLSRIRSNFKVELPLRRLFNAPTVAELGQVIGELQQQDLELSAPPIVATSREKSLPLSFAQQRLWFLNELESNSGFYNIPIAFRLEGSVCIAALEQSLIEIITRHESLRTNFITVDGKPTQVIHRERSWTLDVVDLQNLSTAEQERAATEQAQQQAYRGFDLANESLIRGSLLVLSETEHILVICMHHIISDGWSMGVFVLELEGLYNAYCLGEDSPLTELPIQYADFAVWQRKWLVGDVLQNQLDYWEQQLASAPALLSLPTDRPRPAVQSFSGGHIEFALSVELTAKLTKLSQEEGCTLFMTLLAAFDTLLYRYTGTEDILVGTPIANREHSEIEGLIGFFVNTLVMRTDVSGNPSFKELLTRVREMAMDAYAMQNLPFEMLVEALQPERNLSHTPLFQVMFALQNAPNQNLELTGLSVNLLPIENATAKFDLTLSMQNTGDGLVGMWEYNTDLFNASTIERMIGHYVTLLEGIVNNPSEQIGQLPLLRESEKEQLLVEWNRTQADYPIDKCIHELFEEQVGRTPEAVAVVYDNQQLTYHQLNSRANQLAHWLQSLGVGPEVLVGICVERSLEMVVGILGILKAGGAYVPLDPEYPVERLSFMLEDAQVSVLLTQQHLRKRLPRHKARILCLDTNWQLLNQLSQNNLISGVQADNLAYVIYTSGSKDQPKGVAKNQLGLSNFLVWQLQNLKKSKVAKTLQFAPMNSDVSFQEMFSTWCSGGTLFLTGEELHKDPLALLDFLQQQSVERLFIPFVELQQLAEVAVDNELVNNYLKEIITAGEQLQITSSISYWLSKLTDDCSLYSYYGHSESHVATTFTLTNSAQPWPVLPPIGRPIPNTEIYILDKYLQAVPVGIPGELYIGGVALARGYLNQPELTQQRFIANPFSTNPGSRLYKTGDLAQYLSDGNIKYLRSIDNQVKKQSFRIEWGEIEAVLREHEHVQTCCVIAREDIRGDQRLVAYIVGHQGWTPIISELRQLLKAKLPEYMLPNAFVILEEMPLTPSGKVDRRALRVIDLQNDLTEKYVAPRTPTEEMLALLWTQVLKVEQVGIHDNFFELGGHSLLATQVVSRIRTSFKVELPLREFFVAATVAQLARAIGQLQQQNLQESIPPILRRAENAELPLSFAQQRLWFLDQLESNSAFYNIPIALRLEGKLEVDALSQSLQEIIERHEVLRTNLITDNGQPRQVIHRESRWILDVVDLKHLGTKERERAAQQAQQQAYRGFDLANESLIRGSLLVLSETEHILVICMHHIISDGWSMGVFVLELEGLYNAYCLGEDSPLTELPIQYADFAVWQRKWLVGDVLQNQLDYWEQQLASAPSLLSLPTDRPRPAVQSFSGGHIEFALSVELTAKLTKLSQEEGCTLFMTLLAAFDTLLYRYTGTEDILVGTPIANREHSEIEGLIGFFVNTLVMRTDVSGNPSFKELLTRVREMAMDAYAMQNLPFEMLVEALQPERNLSHTPLFQVMFALQNAPNQNLELTGLSVNLLPIENATAKFDLTLSMQNTGDGLVGMWEYNTDLFNASTIERMIGHYVTLLEGIVNNPSEQIGQLPLLRESEKEQLLVEWNRTQADYPIDKCIHELFEEQVGRTPEAVAVVYDNQQLTYHQLNSRANQLAHWLQSLGVGPEVLVGICVERSLEMVVGILGILKAGGAYVPLDPEYPVERLSFMLEDAQVSVLLTQQRLLANLPVHQAQVVCLDTDIQLISKFCQDNAIATVQATNLAYVIYTSGSTGQPKGVMLSHRSLCNHMFWMQATFPLTEKDKVLQKTPFSFDASVWEFYAPLLVGGQLVLAQPGGHADPAYLLKVIAQQQVTTVQFVPSLLQILVEQRGIETCYSLKQIFCGGETLPITLQEKLFSNLNVNLHNIYGPTEACIDATFWTCKQGTERHFVPIGRPITNAQIYILDEYLQPLPVGVPGELHIGGAGLARGYLNARELTQEKFIPNPFDKETGSRLYKTGDLARYLEDGNIEYLGRMDNQVKIRGFRIELGEIEAVLSQYPHVQACCVIARSDSPTDQRLIGYIVAQAQQTPSISELRQFLKSKLPDYMVPNAFVILESLPLTPNGKIDRRALPIPSQHTPLDTFVSPRNQLELQLVQIWSKILKLDNVGVKDNFFDLGGHSLLAPYLIAQIKQQFGKDIPLATIFQHPTIEELAIIVQKDTDACGESALVTIQTNGSNPPLFCLPGAGGFPFYLYNLARCLGTDQPFYTFQAQHRNGELAPIRKVEEIAADYIQAIQTVQPTGPYFLAGHSFGGKLVYEMAQQLLRQGQAVALVAILDTTAPLPQVKQEEWDDTRWLIEFANVLKIVFARDLDIDAAPIPLLAPSEQFKYVLEYLKMIDILPPDADTIYLNHLLQAYKADVNAEYVPQQIHPLPITLFRASESSLQEQTVIESKLLQDSAWGWSAFSSKAVDIQFVPGNHITMMTLPHVQVLAERLKACIQQAHNSTADDAIT